MHRFFTGLILGGCTKSDPLVCSEALLEFERLASSPSVALADRGGFGYEVRCLPDSRSQLLRPAPRISAVNDPANESELLPNIPPVTPNVTF